MFYIYIYIGVTFILLRSGNNSESLGSNLGV